MLLTDAALARIITDYEKQIADLKLDAKKEKRVTDATTAATAAKHEAIVGGIKARAKAEIDGLNWRLERCGRDLKSARYVPWYKNSYVSFVSGNLVCGGVVAAAIAASRR